MTYQSEYITRVNDEDGDRKTGEYDLLSDAIDFAEWNRSIGFNAYVTDKNDVTIWPKVKPSKNSFLSH